MYNSLYTHQKMNNEQWQLQVAHYVPKLRTAHWLLNFVCYTLLHANYHTVENYVLACSKTLILQYGLLRLEHNISLSCLHTIH